MVSYKRAAVFPWSTWLVAVRPCDAQFVITAAKITCCKSTFNRGVQYLLSFDKTCDFFLNARDI